MLGYSKQHLGNPQKRYTNIAGNGGVLNRNASRKRHGVPGWGTRPIVGIIPTRVAGIVMQWDRLSWLVMHWIIGMGILVNGRSRLRFTTIAFVLFLSVFIRATSSPLTALTKVPMADPRNAGGFIATFMV